MDRSPAHRRQPGSPEPPRVLLVAEWFLRDALPQAVALVENGAQVALLHVDHAREFGGDVAERDVRLRAASETGVRLISLPVGRKSLDAVRATGQARRAVRSFRPDVAHAHDNGDVALYVAARGVPTFLTVHDPVPHPGHPPVLRTRRPVFAAWRRRAARIIVHGDTLLDESGSALPPEKVVSMPLGVSVRREPAPKPAEPSVLFFGRLEEYKGIDVLLEAMRSLWSGGHPIRLVVAGTGPCAKDIPAHPLITARLDYVPEDDVEDLFTAAGVVALPYTQASQSGVGLRAIAAGVPLVATDVGSIGDLVDDPSAVVPAGDPDALATALLRALDRPAEDRRAIWRRAADTYDWSAIARRQLDLYAEVAGTARPGGS